MLDFLASFYVSAMISLGNSCYEATFGENPSWGIFCLENFVVVNSVEMTFVEMSSVSPPLSIRTFRRGASAFHVSENALVPSITSFL